MFEAIIALVGAVVGVVGGALKSGSEKFAAKSAEYEANIQFQRDKELGLYGIKESQQQTKNFIIVGGAILIVVLMVVLTYKKK